MCDAILRKYGVSNGTLLGKLSENGLGQIRDAMAA